MNDTNLNARSPTLSAGAVPADGELRNSPMRSLERALDVLEVLEDASQPLRLSEIARRAGLHIATAQRILAVLERRHRVARDDAGYRLDVLAMLGAHAFQATSRLLNVGRPVLQDLAAATTLTASLFVRIGWSRLAIARVEGARPLRYELPIGERLPLHLGAGKVLAAYLDPAELEGMLAEVGPIVLVTGKHVPRDDFLANLAAIRTQGYSVAHSERVLGMISVSAPVVHGDGEVIAAVQVAGLAEDLPPDRQDQLTLEVRRAAAAILKRLP